MPTGKIGTEYLTAMHDKSIKIIVKNISVNIILDLPNIF